MGRGIHIELIFNSHKRGWTLTSCHRSMFTVVEALTLDVAARQEAVDGGSRADLHPRRGCRARLSVCCHRPAGGKHTQWWAEHDTHSLLHALCTYTKHVCMALLGSCSIRCPL